VTSIRDRRPEDLDACVEALALVHEADAYPAVWPSDPVRWLTPRTLVHGLVVVDDAAVAGHVLLCRTDRGLEIARLFVIPSARGAGLARTLLESAADSAGEERLDLEVADYNRAAIALYERLGWQRLDSYRADWRAPDGAPALVHRFSLP
jgi:ribosomal-protein-alanine N-acetyltransferase